MRNYFPRLNALHRSVIFYNVAIYQILTSGRTGNVWDEISANYNLYCRLASPGRKLKVQPINYHGTPAYNWLC